MNKTEEFIKKAIEKHGDRYDYSKVEYINSSTKVIIICKEHGEFEQTPGNHLTGYNCKECGFLSLANTKSKSIEKFKEEAQKIHNDKYNYSNVVYKNNNTKVLIICKEHGEFQQTPGSHLSGNGCKKCGLKSTSQKQTKTTQEFIEEAKNIHSDKYDYSNVVYTTANKKITIICKIHGEFQQVANSHLCGCGCPKCSKCYKKNKEEIIEEFQKIHNDKYDYSKVNYTTVDNKVIIICKKHGEFEQIPFNHIRGHGCGRCVCKGYNRTQEEFIKQAIKVHKYKYDYSKVKYITAIKHITIICKKHGEFEQIPDSHLRGAGCAKCAGVSKKTTNEFIEDAMKIHGDEYDYSKVIYIGCFDKVIIKCKDHGDFLQTPDSHLRGSGCTQCYTRRFSKISLLWLEYINLSYNIQYGSILTGGEFKIPNTRYYADGYCQETNTIYEFHGDMWHGNPNNKHFAHNKINSITKTSYGELYAKTQKKKQEIIALGYNYIEMWEYNDWK